MCDEASAFRSCRYVGSCEAHWLLSEYKLSGRSHTVIRLPLHIEQIPGTITEIVFQDGLDVVPEKEDEYLRSMLDAFFLLNKGTPEMDDPTKNQTPQMQEAIRLRDLARTLRYMDVVQHFRYDAKKRSWIARKRDEAQVVARIRDVSIYSPDVFALRMLLLHVRGPTCFDDLKIYNGKQYPTFLETAKARNLMRGDEVYFSTFDDYMAFQNPRRLRILFAVMLMHKTLTSGEVFWLKYRDALSEDFRLMDVYKNEDPEKLYDLVLNELQLIFAEKNVNCATFGLPLPKGSRHQFPADTPPLYNDDIDLIELNEDQQHAVDTIMDSATGKSKRTQFILIGPGGSGKTTVYRKIIASCKEMNLSARVFATTGIAATLLEGGKTVHTGFGIPVPCEKDSISMINLESAQADDLRKAAVLMIDEVSQMSTYTLRVIDQLLRSLMNFDEPFGGKTVVFGGDFRQLLPVVPNGQRTHIVATSVTSNPLWDGLVRLELTQNMRAQHDLAFSNWLLDLGCGSLPATVGLPNKNYIEIPEYMILQVDYIFFFLKM